MFKLNLFAIFWYTTSYSSSCRRSTQTSIKNGRSLLYFWLVLMTLASVLLLCFSNKVVFLSHSKKKMVQFMNFYSEIPKILLNNQTSSILYRRIRAVRKILKTTVFQSCLNLSFCTFWSSVTQTLLISNKKSTITEVTTLEICLESFP